MKRQSHLAPLALVLTACGGLPTFTAELGRESSIMGEASVSYGTVASYLGSAKEGGQELLVYVWLAGVTPELGVRVLSPARGYGELPPASFLEAPRDESAGDAYFDPVVKVERCLDIAIPEELTRPCGEWILLGQNDNSQELPPQPDGERHNALLRVSSVPQSPTRTLARGLYRVTITAARESPRGAWLLQLGLPVAQGEVSMSRSLERLQKLQQSPAR